MTNENVRRWLTVGAAMLWLSACSHTPGAGDILAGASFTTKILADDTKLFTYTQRFARGGLPGGSDEDDMGVASGRGESRSGGAGRSEQVAKISLRGVQAMLAQNHYCRESYVVLEQYEVRNSYVIRGECRDAADSADREKFSQ